MMECGRGEWTWRSVVEKGDSKWDSRESVVRLL